MIFPIYTHFRLLRSFAYIVNAFYIVRQLSSICDSDEVEL